MKSYTDIEQSKKLAEFLPIESADMYYPIDGASPKFGIALSISTNIPCWSLAALLSLIKPVNDNSYTLMGTLDGGAMISFEEVTNIMFQEEEIIDAVFEMIMKLHELKML